MGCRNTGCYRRLPESGYRRSTADGRILVPMPVIIVGADTAIGTRIVESMVEPEREVRAFVSDAAHAERLKRIGVKVALGDVSDPSHVGGACIRCFSVVLITEAATDGRDRAFASDDQTVLDGWAEAARDAGVSRVIWVTEREQVPPVHGIETAIVDPGTPDPVAEIVRLDDAAVI